MSNKFNVIIHTLSISSLGAAAVASKVFTDFSNSLALPVTAIAVGVGIASLSTLFSELRRLKAWNDERELQTRLDDIWRAMNTERDERQQEVQEYHRRLDQEVEAIHNRFEVNYWSGNFENCSRDSIIKKNA